MIKDGGHDDILDAVGWLSCTSVGTDGPLLHEIETGNPDIFGNYYELSKWEIGHYSAFRFVGSPVLRPESIARLEVTTA